MERQVQHESYDEEPVKFCARCYSLKIKYEEALDSEYCADCGSTDIVEDSIYTWDELYQRRYHKKFVERPSNEEGSPVFRMSNRELKEKVYHSYNWKEIIKTLYPNFPGGYSKAESIILMFDKLTKDGRINDLRRLLTRNSNY